MNALLFERPVWFATGPLILEEEPQEMEDFTYHRPVLAAEAISQTDPTARATVQTENTIPMLPERAATGGRNGLPGRWNQTRK